MARPEMPFGLWLCWLARERVLMCHRQHLGADKRAVGREVGPLPAEFQLATVYTAGVCAGAARPEAAQRFLAMLGGAESRELRLKAGFDL